ncbi:MAG TPA: TetR/AcrR family transcriptional regulator [Ilumatobacteraceae bacterium]|jgi:AcrR family transcriptional regulator
MATKRTSASTGADVRVAQPSHGRRSEILDLAAALFAENGIDRTTVREIGQAAGMLSGSLYHYFDSKETIVAEVISGYLEKRLADCQRVLVEHNEPQDRLRALLRTELLDITESNAARVVNTQSRYALGILPTHQPVHDLASQVRTIWLDTIQSGIEHGVFRNDVDAEIFYALARKTASVAQQWVDGLQLPTGPHSLISKFGADRVADVWITLLLDGFCETAAAKPSAAKKAATKSAAPKPAPRKRPAKAAAR